MSQQERSARQNKETCVDQDNSNEECEGLEEFNSNCDWKEYATKSQNWWYRLIDGIREYDPNTEDGRLILLKNIGFALYGVPKEEPTRENMETGYPGCMLKTVKLISEAIISEKNDSLLYISIVYVFVKTDSGVVQSPVFRVTNKTDTSWLFVDNVGRRYKSWKSYLNNNELPKGDFCGPDQGRYHTSESGVLQLHFGKTPAASVGKAVLKGVDTAGMVTNIVATGVLATASVISAPVAGPVLVAAGIGAVVSGVYSAGRSVATLVDMGVHGQSVNPVKQRRALDSWFNVASSTVAVGAGQLAGHVGRMAASGQVVGKTTRAVTTALNVASLAASGAGVAYGAYSLKESYDAGELTTLQVFQFTAQVLFFTHATVNFKTARMIISETQGDVLKQYETSLRSNRHRKAFNRVAKNTGKGMDSAEANAKVIRSIKNIANKDDFYAGIVRSRKHFKKLGVEPAFSENGNMLMNEKCEIHPMDFSKMTKIEKRNILGSDNVASESVSTPAMNMGKTQDYFESGNKIRISKDKSFLTVLLKMNISHNDAVLVLDWAWNIADLVEILMEEETNKHRAYIVKIVIQKVKELEPLYKKGKCLVNFVNAKDWPNVIATVIVIILESGYHLAGLLNTTSEDDKWKSRSYSLKMILQKLLNLVPIYEKGHSVVKDLNKTDIHQNKAANLIPKVIELMKMVKTWYENDLHEIQKHYNELSSSFAETSTQDNVTDVQSLTNNVED